MTSTSEEDLLPKLPIEIWEIISKYLSIQSFHRLRATCKTHFTSLPSETVSLFPSAYADSMRFLLGPSLNSLANYSKRLLEIKGQIAIDFDGGIGKNSPGLLLENTRLFDLGSDGPSADGSADGSAVLEGKLIDVPANYKLSFYIYIFGTRGTVSNILHFTATGKDAYPAGSRVPAIFVMPYSTRLSISLESSDPRYQFNSVQMKEIPSLEMNKMIKVTLLVYEDYAQLQFDNKIIGTMKLLAPNQAQKVRAYASNPWYVSAPAVLLCPKLEPLLEPFPIVLLDHASLAEYSADLSFGNPIAQVLMPSDYILQFTIRPTGYFNFDASVMHITGNAKEQSNGGMIPAIFLAPNSSRLIFYFDGLGYNSSKGYKYDESRLELDLNKDTVVQVVAYGSNVAIKFNGEERVVISLPSTGRIGGPALMYCSSPWKPPALAHISKISILDYSALPSA